MRLLLTFLSIVLFQTAGFSTEAHWLDSFTLTELQIEMLKKWDEENRFDREKLIKFAKAYEKHNLKPKKYIPPHTFSELSEVMEWAEGGAFSVFAPYAGFAFDHDAYRADCPNWTLFTFGRATAKEYLQLDVLQLALQTTGSLQMTYAHHPEEFEAHFLKQAQQKGFDIYLTPLTPP